MARNIHTIFIFRPSVSCRTPSKALTILVWFCAVWIWSVPGSTGSKAQSDAGPTGAKVVEIGAAGAEEAGTLPQLTQELAQRAAAAVSKKDWKTARSAYTEMVEADPTNAPALANLGAVEFQLKEYDAAILHLEKALAAKPGLAQTWLTLGMVHYEREDPMRALSALSRAVAEKPDDPRAHNHLAAAAKALGWLAAAESELQRALDLDPDYAEAHFNLALTYLERRPPGIELARRHYLRAVELGIPRDELMEKQLNDSNSEEINPSETPSSDPAPPSAAPAATKPKAGPKPAASPAAKSSPRSGSTKRRRSPE